eukprot:9218724-Pyramimonas_sp.AAC.1
MVRWRPTTHWCPSNRAVCRCLSRSRSLLTPATSVARGAAISCSGRSSACLGPSVRPNWTSRATARSAAATPPR